MSKALKLFDTLRDREQVSAIWRGLASDKQVSFFQSWGWVELWLDSLPPELVLYLAVVFDREEPVLAFFLGCQRNIRHGFVRSQAIYFNATGDPVYDKLRIEYSAAVGRAKGLGAITSLLRDVPVQWNELYLPGLDVCAYPGSSLKADVDGYKLSVVRDVPSFYVDLEKVRENQGNYIGLLGSNTRAQLRRSYRYFKPPASVELDVAGSVEQGVVIYEELVALHQHAWQQRNQEGAFANDYMYSFHRKLIERRFPRGEVQLIRVRSGVQVVGCLYNFVFNGRVYFYQSGLNYLPDSRVKVGMLCHAEAIRYNSNRGLREYDFLGGNSVYKKRLSTDSHRLVWLKIQQPSLRFWVEDKLKLLKSTLRKSVPALQRGRPL